MSGDWVDLTDGGCGAVDRLRRVHMAESGGICEYNACRGFTANVVASRNGFRPSSRSRMRIAIGTLLSLTAVGIVLLVFSTADRRVAVLQVVRDLPAGSQIGAEDVRSIELSVDPSLAVVKTIDLASVIGEFTKVSIVGGGLLAPGLLQSKPLVAAGLRSRCRHHSFWRTPGGAT